MSSAHAPIDAPLDGAYSTVIALSAITESTTNPRTHFDQTKLDELTESILRFGVLQPILVRPRGADGYELVAGHRRYRGARQACLSEIPAIIRQLDDKEVLEVQVIENLQRQDLHPMEEAEGYERLVREHGYTADTLADKIGKSRSYVYGRMKLTALCPEARQALWGDKITHSVALLIARIADPDLQTKALTEIINYGDDEPMSYREAAEYIERNIMLRLDAAPWKLADALLLPAAGACTVCPLRSGNQKELFGDVRRDDDLCTSPSCFRQKREAWWVQEAAAAQKKGHTILDDATSKKLFRYGSLSNADEYIDTEWPPDFNSDAGSYAELLGKKTPLVVGRDDQGKIYWLIRRADLPEALKRAGHPALAKKVNASSISGSGGRFDRTAYGREQQKRMREYQLRGKVARATVADLIKRVESDVMGVMDDVGFRLIVKAIVAERFWVDPQDLDEIAKHRVLDLGLEDLDHGVEEDAILKWIDGLTAEQLFGLLVGLVFGSRMNPGGTYDTMKREMMEHAGVDVDAITKQVKAELATKAKEDKKAAKNVSCEKSIKKDRDLPSAAGRCQGCGCTEDKPCATDVGPCGWANDEQTLCSNCDGEFE